MIQKIVRAMQSILISRCDLPVKFLLINALNLVEASTKQTLQFVVSDLLCTSIKSATEQLKALFLKLSGAEKIKIWIHFGLTENHRVGEMLLNALLEEQCKDAEVKAVLQKYRNRKYCIYI